MTWTWSGVDRGRLCDWSVLRYPRFPRSARQARKLVADALREWRRQRRAANRIARYGRSIVVVTR